MPFSLPKRYTGKSFEGAVRFGEDSKIECTIFQVINIYGSLSKTNVISLSLTHASLLIVFGMPNTINIFKQFHFNLRHFESFHEFPVDSLPTT